ncbi:SURF1 family cytochrome oxidase biogenesis protein [Cellulomonas aerilata]|uniref:SURF1-like protein n=1 Tax=Cellulomonas aerilata TaxID=515326 RepID=A0A512DFU3_9CELL|nr:SURF1 family protein [Cellulomonas aerilata]GEO35349.1 SURF1-like protein [Cellulomonas aerilata]
MSGSGTGGPAGSTTGSAAGGSTGSTAGSAAGGPTGSPAGTGDARRAALRRAAVKRAAGLVAAAVGLAVVCTALGLWQWHRHGTRSAAIAVVEANFGADPVPLADVLGSAGDPLPAAEEWRPVRVTGRYDAEAAVLLRNRPAGGQVGFHQLVPLVVASGDGSSAVLVVDRGWVPDEASAADARTPAGDVEVVVRLRPDEPASRRGAPAGQVQAIAVRQVLAAGGAGDLPAYAAYGAMVSEDPAGTGRLGPLPQPSTDPGSHLSYALQWWTFALGSLVGFSVMARRELVDADDEGIPDGGPADGRPADEAAPQVPPKAPRRRRMPSAEDEEDALIDAQLRPAR